MTDRQQDSGRDTADANIIDMEMKEVHISNEELAQNYVDTKQAAQLLNNAAERTFYRLLETCKDKFKFTPASVSVKTKNYYLKSDILRMADLLKKQPVVIAYRTERLTATSGITDIKTDNTADNRQNSGRDPAEGGQGSGTSISRIEQDEDTKNTKLAIIEGLKSISEFRSDIRELNDNVRNVNMMMQNTISKVIEQGIDLKERYLKDREERTNIEKHQAEILEKQADSFSKQSEALLELSKRIDQKNPAVKTSNQIILIVFLCAMPVIAAGGGAFYYFSLNQQKMESRFEERLDQEKLIQTEQYKDTIQQLKDSLKSLTVNATVNAAVPPAGQGK